MFMACLGRIQFALTEQGQIQTGAVLVRGMAALALN